MHGPVGREPEVVARTDLDLHVADERDAAALEDEDELLLHGVRMRQEALLAGRHPRDRQVRPLHPDAIAEAVHADLRARVERVADEDEVAVLQLAGAHEVLRIGHGILRGSESTRASPPRQS